MKIVCLLFILYIINYLHLNEKLQNNFSNKITLLIIKIFFTVSQLWSTYSVFGSEIQTIFFET